MATIYIHWPFCLSKCAYCDFNSVAEKVCDFEEWLAAYEQSLAEFANPEPITSIYFGGGTPSLLPPEFVNNLLNCIRSNFIVVSDAEIALEANPGTITAAKALALKVSGINRLSIGVQSIYDSGLKILGRNSHTAAQAIECVSEMAGIFDNISIDLIYNRPTQTPKEWRVELNETLDKLGQHLKHISCYELILEKGTPLYNDVTSGNLPRSLETDEFLDITREILNARGFLMYEVSNYARPGYESQHNRSYWRYENYYGIGPGAHSRLTSNGQKVAIAQEKHPQKWLKTKACVREILTAEDVLKERLIMGLRAQCGIPYSVVENVPNIDEKLKSLLKNHYIICENEKIVMTYQGLKRLNLVIRYIIGV